MVEPIVAPYGSWKSAISAEMLVSGSIRLMELQLDGPDIYWIEGRPEDKGRSIVVRLRGDGPPEDLLPEPFSARSMVHEYGGGAFHVHRGIVFFSNFPDHRIYRIEDQAPPKPITREEEVRYADFVYEPARQRIIAVREDHHHTRGEPVNTIVAVSLIEGEEDSVLVSGSDFYSSPRLSPDGSRLAWLSWNHPDMPWDGSELWMAELGEAGLLAEPRLIAGGRRESICQPEWSPDGTLYFISDRSQWWNIHRFRNGVVEPVCPMEAEFSGPQWSFGSSTYGFLSADRILCSYTQGGLWFLGSIETNTLRFQALDSPFSVIFALRASDHQGVLIAGSTTRSGALIRSLGESTEFEVIRRSAPPLSLEAYTSLPEAVTFETTGGQTAHGFYYPPKNPNYLGRDDERPILMVNVHGGPTGATGALFSLQIQYWTSRGFAVLDINYRGSTGFGRKYRKSLEGMWGVADVDDCVCGARHLVAQGRVDAERLIIRGGSAGGYTALAALVFSDLFTAGASHYGISDLEVLARDTHKFESRYLDRLIGPYPERKDLYRERSPLHHLIRFSAPVIVFQGLDDKVVPPNQAEMLVDALKQRKINVHYVPFEGEGHGFREARSIVRAAEAELRFYREIFEL